MTGQPDSATNSPVSDGFASPLDRPSLEHSLSLESSSGRSVGGSSTTSIPLSTPATSVGLDEPSQSPPFRVMGQSGSMTDDAIAQSLHAIPPSIAPFVLELLQSLEANPNQFDKHQQKTSPDSPPPANGKPKEHDAILDTLSRIAQRLDSSAPPQEPRSPLQRPTLAPPVSPEAQTVQQHYEQLLADQEVRHAAEMKKSQIHHDDEVR